MSEEGELLWAQTCCGPVHATGDLTLEPWCYECGGQVFRRRAHKRRRNGVIFDVRAHFAHRNTGTSCKGESINHLAAKDAVQHHHRNLHWFVPCAGCTMDYEVHIPRDTKAVVEQSFGAYRLDVGFCKEDGHGRLLFVRCSHAIIAMNSTRVGAQPQYRVTLGSIHNEASPSSVSFSLAVVTVFAFMRC